MESAEPNGNGTLNLHDCVTLLRSYLENEWMRTFLLGIGGSSSDLSILTSKTHIEHAFVGNLNVDFSSGESYRKLFSQNSLMLPAFCFGRYSAVIFTEERFGNRDVNDSARGLLPKNMIGICADRIMFSHAIRDEVSGTLLKVNYDEPTHAKIMIVTQDSATNCRHRAMFRIEKKILETSNYNAMMENADPFMLVSDYPACPVSPGNICTCEQPKPRIPSHPLDLATVSNNLKLLVGVYSGTVSASSTRSIQNSITPVISVIGGLMGATEPESLSKRLHSWTISHALTKYFRNSVPSMPSFSAELVATAHKMIAENLETIGFRKPLTYSTDDSSNKITAKSNASDPFQTQLYTATHDLSVVPFSSSVQEVNVNNDLPEPWDPLDPNEFVPDADDLVMPLPLPTTAPATIDEVALAPKPPNQAPENLGTKGKDKDTIRKIRNRESAARSNLKKRQRIAALKKNTADAKDRQAQLKQKLEELQRINGSLRQQIELVESGAHLVKT